MDLRQKIMNLSQAAALDCEGAPAPTNEARKAQFIAHSRAFVTHPARGKMPVMRIMQTSACEYNCRYCPFQAGRNYRRVWLKPEELAAAFDQMQRKKLVEGLFLSSGIVGGGAPAMDRMLATATCLCPPTPSWNGPDCTWPTGRWRSTGLAGPNSCGCPASAPKPPMLSSPRGVRRVLPT